MRTPALAGIVATTILAGAAALALNALAAGPSHDHAKQPPAPAAAPAAPAQPQAMSSAGRKVLYWQNPDNAADFSPKPKKTPDGREFTPVYDDEAPDFKEVTEAKKKAERNKGRKLLYYRNPMGLPDTSPVPKKDWMGMDYIPVYEGEDDAGASVTISLDRVQRSGVRVEKAEMRVIERHVRAPGIAKPDERTLRVVSLRSEGFIEKLYVNETGRHVKAGEPLFRVYSPQVVSAQVDFRTNARAGVGGDQYEASAVQRLRNLDVPPSVIEQLRKGGGPVLSFDWPSPVSGYVMEKNVVEGQMAKAGEALFRLAGLDPIWIIADVPEQDVALVKEGAAVNVGFRAFPERLFSGRVTFILHELDAKTRTAKVRIEVANPDHAIRHEMFADVEIAADGGKEKRLTVPVSAVIDSGSRQVVLVDRGEGRFEPRNVKLGVRGDGFVEVKEGVTAGETVVVAANFLIDAESNIRSALKAFTADTPSPASSPAGGESAGSSSRGDSGKASGNPGTAIKGATPASPSSKGEGAAQGAPHAGHDHGKGAAK